jgi:hypothetical protein
MIFMTTRPPSIGRLHEQRDRPRAADGPRQLPLVAGAAAGDAPGGDLAALGDEAAEPARVLVVDQVDAVDAELADLAPSEPAPLLGLPLRRNGSVLLTSGGRAARDLRA